LTEMNLLQTLMALHPTATIVILVDQTFFLPSHQLYDQSKFFITTLKIIYLNL